MGRTSQDCHSSHKYLLGPIKHQVLGINLEVKVISVTLKGAHEFSLGN